MVRHEPPATPRQPWRVVVKDDTGFAELVFFAANPKAADDRAQRMPPGAKLLVSGKLEEFNGRITMPHPDHVLPAAQADRLPAIEPVWRADRRPVAAPGGQRHARRRCCACPTSPNGTTPRCCGARNGRRFADALRAVQAPGEPPDDRPARAAWPTTSCSPARSRWAWCAAGCAPARAAPCIGDGALRAKALERFGLRPDRARR